VKVLVRVVAPHFVAGLIMRDDVCVEAAPILRWALGKSRDELRAYFARKGWRASIVPR
jgi:hypothetical protein